jgi:hypothetical protein
MATAVIIDTSKSRTSTAKSTDYPVSSVTDIQHSAKITDIQHSAKPQTVDYSIVKITDIVHTAKAISVLPFYVRFTNIGIPGYGPNNTPPIGIAVVGVNNYIL